MRVRSLAQFAVFGFAVALTGCSGCGQSGSVRLTAGGATFPDPIVQKWAAEYRKAKGTEIDYTKKGSGFGIQQVTAKTFDFGCSDAPMNAKETEAAKAAGGEVIHVPVTMGAVAVIYNLPEVSGELKLDGPTLANIYLRKVTTWNHPAIAALNSGVSLPDKPITPVYRAEDSGTTNIFTEYLAKVNPEFKEAIGVSKKPKWPEGGIGQEGSDGVTSHVTKTPYCVGYVEVLYAKRNKVATALLKNKAGEFVGPTAEGVAAAASAAASAKPEGEPYTLHELTFSLTNADGPGSYPIGGVSYAILFKKQPKDKGQAVVDFLKWAVTEGQKYAGDLDYAPLPKDLQDKAVTRLGQVTFE